MGSVTDLVSVADVAGVAAGSASSTAGEAERPGEGTSSMSDKDASWVCDILHHEDSIWAIDRQQALRPAHQRFWLLDQRKIQKR